MSRLILAVPSGVVDDLCILPGFTAYGSAEVVAELADRARWGPKGRLELDETQRQLIPYAVLQRGESILAYRRGRAVGDPRLRGKYSIGVGGHVERSDLFDLHPSDADVASEKLYAIHRACYREIREETGIDSIGSRDLLGLVRDDSDAVGRCHLGIAFRIQVEDSAEARCRDGEIEWCGFVEPAQLATLHQSGMLEGWSAILGGALDLLKEEVAS